MVDSVDSDDAAPGKATVFIVEDDAPVRTEAAGTSAGAGYRVIEAKNSAVALRLMAEGVVPDVLVTAVNMRGSIDGYALAHIVATRWPRAGVLIRAGQAQPRLSDMPAGAVFLQDARVPGLLLNRIAALCPSAKIAA